MSFSVMARTRIFVLVVLVVSASDAQICDVRTGAAMQMKVQLTFDDQAPDAAPGSVSTQNDAIDRGDTAGNKREYDFLSMQIRLQLQDPTGGTFQEQMPTSDGQVRMTVCRKSIYRLRVTGPTIEETDVDSVQPGRGDNIITVVLHRKLSNEERKAQEPTVSMHRLRIPVSKTEFADFGQNQITSRSNSRNSLLFSLFLPFLMDFSPPLLSVSL